LKEEAIPARKRGGTCNGEKAMFNNLDEQIETTAGETPTQAARVLRYLIVAVLSIILFGGLFLGVWFLEF
jgi:hypothetical protein